MRQEVLEEQRKLPNITALERLDMPEAHEESSSVQGQPEDGVG